MLRVGTTSQQNYERRVAKIKNLLKQMNKTNKLPKGEIPVQNLLKSQFTRKPEFQMKGMQFQDTLKLHNQNKPQRKIDTLFKEAIEAYEIQWKKNPLFTNFDEKTQKKFKSFLRNSIQKLGTSNNLSFQSSYRGSKLGQSRRQTILNRSKFSRASRSQRQKNTLENQKSRNNSIEVADFNPFGKNERKRSTTFLTSTSSNFRQKGKTREKSRKNSALKSDSLDNIENSIIPHLQIDKIYNEFMKEYFPDDYFEPEIISLENVKEPLIEQ